MIVVVGRPGLSADGNVAGSAGLIALAAAQAGGSVELVGSVGDDSDGDAAITALGRAGIGHAAVLRDPAGVTRRESPAAAGDPTGPLPRLDAADLDLGLRYLAECQVLVVAEPLSAEVVRVAADAAAYHGAPLVVVAAQPGERADAGETADLPDDATVLEMPEGDEGAFATLVGVYATKLDGDMAAADAWRAAVEASGWEKAASE